MFPVAASNQCGRIAWSRGMNVVTQASFHCLLTKIL